MGELLDREFQREILHTLRDRYPHSVNVRSLWGAQEDNRLLVNLSYLADHGLITLKRMSTSEGIHMGPTSITALGMDFIADDGGLTAILGVVTVRLHEDTIKALLIDRIEKSEGDDTIKGLLIARVKEMPAQALKSTVERALAEGLDRVPDLLSSLSKWLGL